MKIIALEEHFILPQEEQNLPPGAHRGNDREKLLGFDVVAELLNLGDAPHVPSRRRASGKVEGMTREEIEELVVTLEQDMLAGLEFFGYVMQPDDRGNVAESFEFGAMADRAGYRLAATSGRHQCLGLVPVADSAWRSWSSRRPGRAAC